MWRERLETDVAEPCASKDTPRRACACNCAGRRNTCGSKNGVRAGESQDSRRQLLLHGC